MLLLQPLHVHGMSMLMIRIVHCHPMSLHATSMPTCMIWMHGTSLMTTLHRHLMHFRHLSMCRWGETSGINWTTTPGRFGINFLTRMRQLHSVKRCNRPPPSILRILHNVFVFTISSQQTLMNRQSPMVSTRFWQTCQLRSAFGWSACMTRHLLLSQQTNLALRLTLRFPAMIILLFSP